MCARADADQWNAHEMLRMREAIQKKELGLRCEANGPLMQGSLGLYSSKQRGFSWQ